MRAVNAIREGVEFRKILCWRWPMASQCQQAITYPTSQASRMRPPGILGRIEHDTESEQ